MNTKKKLTLLAICFGLSASALANDAHHPDKVAATPAAASAPKQATDVKAMTANAAKLQAQVKRIARMQPGSGRDKLVAEHLHTLHESMEMAEGMMSDMEMEHCPMMKQMMGGKGGMSMGQGMGMGMNKDDAAKPAASDTADRMDRMEKRMDMMEQMMKGDIPKH